MRIQRLEVEGFRSLKKVSWEPGALNVVIGANGSGKSNLLQLLSLINSLPKGQLKDFIADKGGPVSLCWDGQSEIIQIKASYTLDLLHIEKTLQWQIILETDYLSNDYFIRSEHVSFPEENNKHEGILKVPFNKSRYKDQPLHIVSDIIRHHKYESILTLEPTSKRLSKKEKYKFFSSRLFIGFNVFSYFDTSSNSSCRRPVVTSFDKNLDSDASNLIQVLHTLYASDRNFEADIDSAMSAAFGSDYEKLVFPPAADQRVQLRIRWKSLKREQSALDISDGTLRFLYLLAILANPEPSPLIAIDEPETGLHPSMFPIIAEFAQECSRKSQIIFTTHSPQFLDAFGDSPPTTTVAQWRDGETVLKVLEGERLAKWLKHYSLGQMFMSGELEEFA